MKINGVLYNSLVLFLDILYFSILFFIVYGCFNFFKNVLKFDISYALYNSIYPSAIIASVIYIIIFSFITKNQENQELNSNDSKK